MLAMELFRDIKDIHMLAGEIKRRYPHLSEEVDFIKEKFSLDKMELEVALMKLRKLAIGERLGFLAKLQVEEGYTEFQDLES